MKAIKNVTTRLTDLQKSRYLEVAEKGRIKLLAFSNTLHSLAFHDELLRVKH